MQKVHDFLGEQIAYAIQGKGRTIVLIHGFLGSKTLWSPLRKKLKEKFRVISIDLPGHGESNSIGYVHTMEIMADLINSILSAYKIRKAVLVGHSLGGYVCLAYAEKYPDKLHGLIMINSTANSDSTERISSRNQLINLVKQNKDRAIETLIPSFFVGESLKIKRLKSKYLKEAKKCTTRGIIASIEGMKIRNEREIILKFAPFPYLYIIGEQDPILDKETLISQVELGEKGFKLMLENSAHMSFLEEEEKVYKAIKQFSEKLLF
ncbi:MAG: alpha/beta hydrolase [Bacteroidetes bacterium]|nr:MAG: alpha/beta hydrolase [Bacteroidota bacterium]MBL1143504.1 alpha/beta hydrolase [Bacteroidota bacterium]NOG56307.1 alpha/beta hydrolase [Bacteroidota bacterium]